MLVPRSSSKETRSSSKETGSTALISSWHQTSGSDGDDSASQCSSSELFADPSQTMIFFDWDDTLFPTSELFDRLNVPRSTKQGRSQSTRCPQLEQKLHSWRHALGEYLSRAMALSEHVAIVTNATRPWVTDCIDEFAPTLRPLIDRINVVYAVEALKRDREPCARCVKHSSPKSGNTMDELNDLLTRSKFSAMREEARRFYSRYPSQTWKNILSLGDMQYEQAAAQELAFSRVGPERERLRTKTLLLPGSPSVSEITLRLQFSKVMLPAYVLFDGDFDIDLRTSGDPLEAIAEALEMPTLRDVPFSRHAWGRQKTPDDREVLEALDELSFAVHSALS